MAESSILWTTDGTGDGTNSGYTMAQVTEWMRMLMAGLTGADLSGVAPDYLNELAVTGTSSPVAVDTGGALVYGFPYFNSASVNVVVSTPSSDTRIDCIVLEADWTAQTVRISSVAGSEGGAAPALTQSAGSTWQMKLAEASITTGGTITVTDFREWLNAVGDGAVSTAKLAADAVDGTKIADDAIDSEHYTDASIDIAHMSAEHLNMMIIPMFYLTTGVAPAVGWQTAVAAYGATQFDADNLPTGSTVKLCAVQTAGSGGTQKVRLYDNTGAAAITGSEVTTTSTTSGGTLVVGSDIKANLPSGDAEYRIQTDFSVTNGLLYNVFILVEW